MPPESPTSASDTTAAALACGNCGAPLRVLALAGHYGRPVEIDLCEPCHLVWFDAVESARVAGPALLELVGAMAAAQALPHQPLRPDATCPRCRGGLKRVHNRTRWGPSLQLECRQGHGAWQTFAEYLAEKGLVRPLSSADRAQLLQRDGRLDCVNCGAAIGATDSVCSHCLSVPSLIDVARLARALDPEGALRPSPVHGAPAQRSALQCQACGAALPAGPTLQCASCHATVAVSRLADAHAQLVGLAPALRAHAERPAPEVVRARLAAQSADLPRRRAWAAQMQAEADAQRSGGAEVDLDWLLQRRWRPWQIGVVLALLAALGWLLS